jgi:2-C-methyl-D-erythritol 4-phosphate cytidylyltransferase
MNDFSVIIVAGGSGSRMGLATKKALIEVAGAPLVVHSARAFTQVPGIGEIIVLLPADVMQAIAGDEANVAVADLPPDAPSPVPGLRAAGVARLVVGGPRRQDSVLNGLWACDSKLPYVMIHDAARPFVTEPDLVALMDKTRATGATILAHPVRDTIKQVDGEVITGTVDRSTLWSAQTPQAFRREQLMKAFQRFNSRNVTDDAAMAALAGIDCAVVHGGAANFKVTTPEDLELAEALLAMRAARNGDIRPASAVFRQIHGGETVFDLKPQ